MPSNHVEFTREMREAGYTILVPNMLEFHFSLIVKVLRLNGYNAELLTNSGPNVMAEGLKYVHNDTCVPALLVIGQFPRRAALRQIRRQQGRADHHPDRRRLPRQQLHLSAAQGAQKWRGLSRCRSSPST